MDLFNQLADSNLAMADLKRELLLLKEENKSLKSQASGEKPEGIKWGCYKFPDNERLYYIACYHKGGKSTAWQGAGWTTACAQPARRAYLRDEAGDLWLTAFVMRCAQGDRDGVGRTAHARRMGSRRPTPAPAHARRMARPITGASEPEREGRGGEPVPIVTMLNQKGGVGKTSTCHHLAGALAGMGKRVLLVDNDPQSSLTQGIFGPAYMAALDPGETIAGIYRGDAPLPEQVIRPTPFAGVDLLPGSEAATDYNVPRPHAAPWVDQAALREFMSEAIEGYDLALIDCAPNLHLNSWAALAASDYLIVPLQAEDYGSQGLGPVRDSVEAVRAAINPRLALLGYLLTMYRPRAAIHQVYEGNLRQAYGDDVFAVAVPDALDFKEAIGQRKTIAAYKPKGASAKAMRALADEVLARIVRATAGQGLERGAA